MSANNPTQPPSSARDRRAHWLAIISGERRGPCAAVARAGLAFLSGVYRAGLAAGDLRFCCSGMIQRAPRPVISVGNITVGGTGKTPMVAYLARLITEVGGKPLIVSRGYGRPRGAAIGELNEEARELAGLCPGIPHVQNPDRAAAIRAWTATNTCDLIILDDGFQHRRLARDLDIVLIDATCPFGYGHVLPRGLLREPPSALRRADMLIITRTDLVPTTDLARLKANLARLVRPDVPVLVAEHRPAVLRLLDGTERDIAGLRGQPIAAACGIGNPDAFRRTLADLGADVRIFRSFDDHHAYTRDEMRELLASAENAGAKMLVTTGKDSVKWRQLLEKLPAPAAVTVAAVEVALVITEGEEVLRRSVANLLAGRTGQR